MTRSLYLDCTCGASGDMLAAALLDAGADEARMRAALDSLPMAGEFEVRVGRVSKGGLDACDFDVIVRSAGDEETREAHRHEHRGHHHGHGHDHVHHHLAHRGLAEIKPLIDAADMTSTAKDLAHRAFDILARAEAAAHGAPLDQVHFHEVGAVDSIVDTIAVAVLVDSLAPERIYATPLPDGHGTIRCQHGVIPVPVPAVVNICAQQGIPLAHVDVEGELVTPTGAALIASLGARFALPAAYAIGRVGIGAGKRSYAVPSLVRALIIDEGPAVHADRVVKLECDIDDASPEVLAYAAERLTEAGALEAHWLPIFTKKGRPAYQLQVFAAPQDAKRLEGIIFAETTTIGVRRCEMERTALEREERAVETALGAVRVKTVTLPDGTRRDKVEHDDLAAIARAAHRPLIEVRRELRHPKNV